MKLTILVPLVAALLLAAGCLSSAPKAASDAPKTQSAGDAGARTGTAVAAPSQPYEIKLATDSDAPPVTAKAYPLKLKTNAAKAPVHKEITGTYNLTECSQFGNLNPVRSGWRWTSMADLAEPGDVFTYALNLTFTNAENSWGDLHLYFALGSKNDYWPTPVAEERGLVAENFTGQGYRVTDKDPAWVAVSCWYGQVTTPIEYKVTIDLTFGQDAVPAETPFLVTVPPGATQLFVTGVPYDAVRGVLSHFRVFDTQDRLVCECALSPLAQATAVKLSGPGDHVILVDHSSGGFVALALDVPPTDPLKPLGTTWKTIKLFDAASDSSVDKVVEVTIPTVPLVMNAWVNPAVDNGLGVATGKGYSVEVQNARGVPLVSKWAGFVVYTVQTPVWWSWNMMGLPIPGGEWAFKQDHHAYSPGAHKVHVKAEELRGTPTIGYLTYERS